MEATEQPDGDYLHDDLMQEYFKVADIVSSIDQRLLTIKGWGVTLSLASLGLAFQQEHYGLFLVAALSGLAFWIVEGTTKFHQIRYYPRMGDIEAAAFELYRVDRSSGGPVSSPLIDWSWWTSYQRIRGGESRGNPWIPRRWPDKPEAKRRTRWGRVRYSPMLYPHVMFPHIVSLAAGLILFTVGLAGRLGPI